ncbi:prepilin-type N-terminal cleavage/methylation domain-containing protein [Nocardioides sp. J9]|uniref:type IV pilus modification PilV family protein n=1 Tax=unclassified Nocardioides TaxID=2615069 RepID=UPI00048B32FF|nr:MULTISPECIES: type II secretion system protein [unclassified Nocardioides]TWG96440.1 prepilin-type N-terminal cleavage/methylation domain-containing protein [Nocardioides sp. J9]
MEPRRRRLDDQGVTLVETLVAIVILGIAAVAVLAGFQMGVTASDIHRKQTTGGAYARSYAEALQKHLTETPAAWVACAAPHTYDVEDLPAPPPDWPPGYQGLHTQTTPLTAYDGNGGSCGPNTAVRIKLEVSSPDSRAVETLDLILQRPCGGDACTP